MQPYAQQYVQNVSSATQPGTPYPYPNYQVAGFSPQQQSALGYIQGLGPQGPMVNTGFQFGAFNPNIPVPQPGGGQGPSFGGNTNLPPGLSGLASASPADGQGASFGGNTNLPPGITGLASTSPGDQGAPAAPGGSPIGALFGQQNQQQTPILQQALQRESNVMGQNAINNPLLSQYFQQAAGDVLGGLNATALKAGAFGGSGAQQEAGQALSNLATQIYTPAWQQQEQMQQQAAYMTPYLAQSAYMPAQQMMQAGGLEQQQMQNFLNALYQNQFAAANWPYELLNRAGTGIGMAMGAGGVTTVQTPTTPQMFL